MVVDCCSGYIVIILWQRVIMTFNHALVLWGGQGQKQM